MTVYLPISLSEIPCVHHVILVLANPTLVATGSALEKCNLSELLACCIRDIGCALLKCMLHTVNQ